MLKRKNRVCDNASSSDSNEELDVGRKTTPRKKQRSKKRMHKVSPSAHVQALPSYMLEVAVESDDLGEGSKIKVRGNGDLEKLGKVTDAGNCESVEENTEDFFTEMFNQPEEADEKASEERKSGFTKRSCETKNTRNASVLDDLFTSFEVSTTTRKPPPKSNLRSPRKKASHDYENFLGRQESSKADDNVYKHLDDIFSAGSTSSSQEEEALHLDESTLNDSTAGGLQDSCHAKHKSKYERGRRTVVDRLIAESEAEYRQLFAKGQLVKRQETNQSRELTNQDNSQSLFD